MRKFKVKNRKKRSYTRKEQIVSYSSISRATLIGLAPFFCIAVAFLTIAILNTQSLPQLQPISFSFPEIVLPSVQPPAISFRIPTNTISLPTIDFTPFIQFLMSIPPFFQKTITLLNPLPIFSSITQSIFFVANIAVKSIYSGFTMGIRAVIGFELFLLTSFVMSLYDSIFDLWHALELIMHGVQFIFITFSNILLSVLKTIQTLMLAAGKGILSFLQMVGNKIALFFTALITLIETPFKILGGYYQQSKPYLDILGVHINKSFHNMSTGFTDLSTVSSEIMKAAQK